jgi:hypothetical protein
MKIDYTGYELFKNYCYNKAKFEDFINHPSYKTILNHGFFYETGISEKVIKKALETTDSSFYGFYNIEIFKNNISKFESLIGEIKLYEKEWIKSIENIYFNYFPEKMLEDITIYPILGYDVGIGFENSVCLNISNNMYLENSKEIFYWIIHEVFHVIYNKIHMIPKINSIISSKNWLDYFKLFLQNEGYAVYFPLNSRIENNDVKNEKYPGIYDYKIILDDKKINFEIQNFLKIVKNIEKNKYSEDECIEYLFGNFRYTYRIGCEMIRRVYKVFGKNAVKEAIYEDYNNFFDNYIYLLQQ